MVFAVGFNFLLQSDLNIFHCFAYLFVLLPLFQYILPYKSTSQ
jgi:hypothetical protein